MASFYPPEVLETVQLHNDIVEVVSQYFPLKRSGQNFKTLCPFHSERTPSFYVNPQRQIFHCFGCGAGGDVFSFVMRQENLTFPEAVRHLARRANIELPATEPGTGSRRERLLKLHELAASFYHWGLLESENGKVARAYLEKREIRRETIVRFKMGYAQPGWDSLLRHAAQKGYEASVLAEAGLALPRSRSEGYYDRFRNRLVIPVCDSGGRVIAFGARVLDDSEPKYINSPDTLLFHKGQMLFGLHLAKGPIARAGQAILGEGYFDVIRAHQEKVENMVCSQGTAFTPSQAQILKRFTDKVVTAFDADQAGTEASIRGLSIFLQNNFEVRIALLPLDEDPDSYIRKKGSGAFLQVVEKSIPLIDFKLKKLGEKFDLRSDRGKLNLVREMLETIRQIESAVLRDSYIKKLAQKLNVSEASVREEYGKSRERTPAAKNEAAPGRKWDRAEAILLKSLIESDKMIKLILNEFNPAEFSPPLAPIAEKMLELYRSGRLPLSRTLASALRQEEEQGLISRLLLEPSPAVSSPREVFELLVSVKKRNLKRKLEEFRDRILQTEKRGEPVASLQRECVSLRRELERLSSLVKEKFGK